MYAFPEKGYIYSLQNRKIKATYIVIYLGRRLVNGHLLIRFYLWLKSDTKITRASTFLTIMDRATDALFVQQLKSGGCILT